MNKETLEKLDSAIETIKKTRIKIKEVLETLKQNPTEEKEKEKEKEWDMDFIGESVYDYVNYKNI